MAMQRLWPVLLSGGLGTRLWPLSRAASPKQLVALAGTDTMLQASARRTADTGRFMPPLVVASALHGDIIRAQLAAIGQSARLILEPFGRNTAPAIALAALVAYGADADAMLLVMPSDHVIADTAAFLAAVVNAMPLAQDDWLVTFGIAADTPETGYGYIEAGAQLAQGVHQVRRFVEKPDRLAAQAYLDQGDFYWNGGIFLFRAAALLAALAAHAPAILAACKASLPKVVGATIDLDAQIFATCPSDSIDYAVFEKAERVAVAPVSIGWSDIGSWDALYAIATPDTQGNVMTGDAIYAEDSHNCLLRSEGPILAAVGVQNLNIIATDDAILVTARGSSQNVKAVVTRLAGDAALALPRRERHAWGDLRRLTEATGAVVEEISLRDGALWSAQGTVTLLEGKVTIDGRCHVTGGHAEIISKQSVVANGPATILLVRRNPQSESHTNMEV